MKYLFFLPFLFFYGCSIKNYEITKTKVIVIKSPKLKFADVGYIRSSGKNIEVELFTAGRAVEKITINHLICTSKGCMSKGGFNKDYLNDSYPNDILQNIILGKKIYSGKNFLKIQSGFCQHIKNRHVDITYKVNPHAIYFKDKTNKIILKFKDTNEQ